MRFKSNKDNKISNNKKNKIDGENDDVSQIFNDDEDEQVKIIFKTFFIIYIFFRKFWIAFVLYDFRQ